MGDWEVDSVNSRFHAAVANSAGTCAQRGAPAACHAHRDGACAKAALGRQRRLSAGRAFSPDAACPISTRGGGGTRLLPGSDRRELEAKEVAVAALETTGGSGQAHVLLACHGSEMAGF
jgi:hypothetical protein